MAVVRVTSIWMTLIWMSSEGTQKKIRLLKDNFDYILHFLKTKLKLNCTFATQATKL